MSEGIRIWAEMMPFWVEMIPIGLCWAEMMPFGLKWYPRDCVEENWAEIMPFWVEMTPTGRCWESVWDGANWVEMIPRRYWLWGDRCWCEGITLDGISNRVYGVARCIHGIYHGVRGRTLAWYCEIEELLGLNKRLIIVGLEGSRKLNIVGSK